MKSLKDYIKIPGRDEKIVNEGGSEEMEEQKKEGLSTGKKVGLAVGGAGLLLLAGAGIKKLLKKNQEDEFDDDFDLVDEDDLDEEDDQ